MSRYHSYLNTTVTILEQYQGGEPFASFLKKFFADYKKAGSKDRKVISHLCYCFFRLGKFDRDIPVAERILAGLFLCSREPGEILGALRPEWNEKVREPLSSKMDEVGIGEDDIFPWRDELSEGIEATSFSRSFFVQPDLFLRLRPGHERSVMGKLAGAGISFEQLTPNCLSLSNASRVDKIIAINREAVIQDYSSQQTAEFLGLVNKESLHKAWDCCAASGGKSILMHDLFPTIKLAVSDIRESILLNLENRFREAGIRNYSAMVIDLVSGELGAVGKDFDLVLCDAPCTGSGTWARTPEQLCFFQRSEIDVYARRQKAILVNVAEHVRPGGHLLYVTCSVFKKENEEVVEFIRGKSSLQLVKQKFITGYEKKADSLFAALFRKGS
jgi:16S rRNA (cytosine967-C5)-methyltransferase